MNLCYVALLIVVALCSVTATSTPQDSPSSFGDCSYPLHNYSWVWNNGVKCLVSGSTQAVISQLFSKGDLETFRLFFAELCRKNATVRDCLREQRTIFETCQNVKRVKIHEIYRDGIENLMNVGCVESGEKLATVFQGLYRLLMNGTTDWEGTNKCMQSTLVVFNASESAQVDLSSTIYILYQELPKFKECFSKITLEQPFGELANWFLGEIISSFKCVSPHDVALVACSSIDASHLRSPTMCDVIPRPEGASVYDSLETMAAGCFGETVVDNIDHDHASDIKVLRDSFKIRCRNTIDGVQCPFAAEVFADKCLDETQRKEFSLLAAAMKSALVSACAEDQKLIAETMYEVYRLNKTSGRDVMRECIDVVKATRKQGGSSVAKNLRFYREAGTFKGCLLEKLSGDRRSVVAAKAVMDEILRELMCLHPETGAGALCSTLVTNTAGGL